MGYLWDLIYEIRYKYIIIKRKKNINLIEFYSDKGLEQIFNGIKNISLLGSKM